MVSAARPFPVAVATVVACVVLETSVGGTRRELFVTDAKVLNKEDSEHVSEAVKPDDGVAEPGSEPVQVEGKKGARSRRPNYNIYGPDWV